MAKRPSKAQVNIPLPQEELDAFRAAAAAVGLSLSAWLRQAARAAAGLPSWRPPAEPLSVPAPSPRAVAGEDIPGTDGPPRARPGRAAKRW